jgi:hypothetical protein
MDVELMLQGAGLLTGLAGLELGDPPLLIGQGPLARDPLVGPAQEHVAQRQADHGRHQEHAEPRGDGAVPPAPAGQPGRQRLAIHRGRLVGQPVLQVVGQGPRRGVPILRPQ